MNIFGQVIWVQFLILQKVSQKNINLILNYYNKKIITDILALLIQFYVKTI